MHEHDDDPDADEVLETAEDEAESEHSDDGPAATPVTAELEDDEPPVEEGRDA